MLNLNNLGSFRRFSSWFLLAITVFGIAKIWTIHAAASCEVSITPFQFTPDSSNNVTISVTNTSDQKLEYITISRPSNNYSIIEHGISGWTVTLSSERITAVNGSLVSGSTEDFEFTVYSGGSADQDDWVVYSAETSDGANPVFCSGNVSSMIGEPSDTTAPTVSSVSASGISNTAATVTWTTNEPSTSVVAYGTDESYGDLVTSDMLTTLHSLSIPNLVANTEYHVRVTSVDSSGNSSSSGDEVFNTSNTVVSTTPSRTPTPTTASGQTITTTPSSTPTPTPTIDTEKPIVTLTDSGISISNTVPVLVGTAIDNIAVESLEYSTNGGKQWRILKGWNRVSTTTLISYSFTPIGMVYGENRILIRAKDAKGNTGLSANIRFILDDRGPILYEHTSLETPFSTSPVLRGSVDDMSGESSISYTIDNGESWLPADMIRLLTPQKTGFEITLPALPDGNYPILLKTMDRFGSVTEDRLGELVIDRIPPKIGSSLYSLGSLILQPDAQNHIHLVEKKPITMSLSVIGGAISVSASVINDSNDTESHRVSLVYNRASNVWTGQIIFPNAGRYRVDVTAIDGAGKTDELTVSHIEVEKNGSVRSADDTASDITLRIFEKDRDTNQFHLWDGRAFGYNNPQRSNNEGDYSLALPKGEFYIEFSGDSIQTTITDIFTLSKFTYITDQFVFSPRRKITLLFLSVRYPQFPWMYEKIRSPESMVETAVSDTQNSRVSWKDIYTFARAYSDAINDIPTVVLVAPTWHPDILQIVRTVVTEPKYEGMQKILIAPQESKSTVELFRMRGGFNLLMVPDPTSTILPMLQSHTVPILLVSSKENGRMTVISEPLFW